MPVRFLRATFPARLFNRVARRRFYQNWRLSRQPFLWFRLYFWQCPLWRAMCRFWAPQCNRFTAAQTALFGSIRWRETRILSRQRRQCPPQCPSLMSLRQRTMRRVCGDYRGFCGKIAPQRHKVHKVCPKKWYFVDLVSLWCKNHRTRSLLYNF